MKKAPGTARSRAPATRRARGVARARTTPPLAPELLAVQVLRDLLVEAWVGAIAGDGDPVPTRATRVPRTRAAVAPAARRAPIRERILAEIERQRDAPTATTAKAGRRRA